MNELQPPKRMDHRVTILEAEVKNLIAKALDMETRLRNIEKSVWKSTGVLAVFHAVVTAAAVAMVKLLIK